MNGTKDLSRLPDAQARQAFGGSYWRTSQITRS
jgi:hypothetical protein